MDFSQFISISNVGRVVLVKDYYYYSVRCECVYVCNFFPPTAFEMGFCSKKAPLFSVVDSGVMRLSSMGNSRKIERKVFLSLLAIRMRNNNFCFWVGVLPHTTNCRREGGATHSVESGSFLGERFPVLERKRLE